MQPNHLPTLGPRYWGALCLASIFGANMGDFLARNLGLGHLAGLPFLAAALAIVIAAERFDRMRHQSYYWIAVIIVRTAATNFADFACGDMKLPRLWVMVALTIAPIWATGSACSSPGHWGRSWATSAPTIWASMMAAHRPCSRPSWRCCS
jgi:repeat uncharacterized protein DUF347